MISMLSYRNCFSSSWHMWRIKMQKPFQRYLKFSSMLLFFCVLAFLFPKCIDQRCKFVIQGLLEVREELRPLISNPNDRLKDLLFLDIALDSTVRTAIERGYEELNSAKPEVIVAQYSIISTIFQPTPVITIFLYYCYILIQSSYINSCSIPVYYSFAKFLKLQY